MQQRINQPLDAQGLDFSAQPERINFRPEAGRLVPAELFVPFGRSRGLIMEIPNYGGDIEIVVPDFLRCAVSDQLEKVLSHYY